MPWINLTVRRGTFANDVQHAVMAKLTDALMFWEKIPDTAEARKKTKGWVYEVGEDCDYNGGSPHHKDPFYFIEVRLPAGRFDTLTKQHLISDFTKIIMLAEGNPFASEDAYRVWETIVELQREDWGIGPIRRFPPCETQQFSWGRQRVFPAQASMARTHSHLTSDHAGREKNASVRR